MDVLQADGGGWQTVDLAPRSSESHLEATDDKARARRRLIGHLLDVQLSQHLTVLTGLGTSLCVLDEKGKRVAPTMWDLWQAVKAAAGDTFTQVLTKIKHPDSSEDIEVLLSRSHLFLHLSPDHELETFIKQAEEVIGKLCHAITAGPWSLPHHEIFIRRLTSRPTRLPRFKLFTTNYDMCWERAASEVRAVILDGFTNSQPREFDGECFNYDIVMRRDGSEGPEYIPKVFQLGKLHGSLDWKLANGRIVNGTEGSSVMIYPRDNKYQLSYSQPFLELMARFQQALRTPNTGIIIAGFGFNDEHLAQPILSAIRSNSSIRVVIVDPMLRKLPQDRAGSKHLGFIEQLILQGDKRIALVASGFEQYVSLMPELSVVPEADSHKQRLQNVDRR